MASRKQTKNKTTPSAKAIKRQVASSSNAATPLPDKPGSEISLELLVATAAQVYPHVGVNLESSDREEFSVKVAAGIIQCAARELEKSSTLPLKEHYTFNEFVTALTGDANSTRATREYAAFLRWKRPLGVDRVRLQEITPEEEAEAKREHEEEILAQLQLLKQKGFTREEADLARAQWTKCKQGSKYNFLDFHK
jgi:hypothetical protein